jgi:hypothetical protein
MRSLVGMASAAVFSLVLIARSASRLPHLGGTVYVCDGSAWVTLAHS